MDATSVSRSGLWDPANDVDMDRPESPEQARPTPRFQGRAAIHLPRPQPRAGSQQASVRTENSYQSELRASFTRRLGPTRIPRVQSNPDWRLQIHLYWRNLGVKPNRRSILRKPPPSPPPKPSPRFTPCVFGPRKERVPRCLTSPHSPQPAPCPINGSPNLKRRAETSELELIASVNGIPHNNSPVVIDRAGQDTTHNTPDEALQGHNPMLPGGILSFFSRMIFGFGSAVTDTVRRFVYPQAYRVAECRTYIANNQVTNKRLKLSREDEETDIVRWVDREGIVQLIRKYEGFAQGLIRICEIIGAHPSREEMNRILGPIGDALADNPADRVFVITGEHDLAELIELQLNRVRTILCQVYDIGSILHLSTTHKTVPSTVDYDISTEDTLTLQKVKTFLSTPALPTVCHDILKIGNEQDLMPVSLFDHLILDLDAILNQLPAPSYVLSSEFHEKLQNIFPPPPRTDLETRFLIPGSFPDVDGPEPEPESSQPQDKTHQTEPASEPTKQSLPDIELASPEYASPVQTVTPIDRVSPTVQGTLDSVQSTTSPEHVSQDRIVQSDSAESHPILPNQEHAPLSTRARYVAEFSPKEPLGSDDTRKLRSILKTRRNPTPKGPRAHRLPKVVRFSASTQSPSPLSRFGLNIRRVGPNRIARMSARSSLVTPVQPEATEGGDSTTPSPVTVPTIEPEDIERGDIDYFTWLSMRARARAASNPEEKVEPDHDARIAALFDLPSVPLRISDATRVGLDLQKEEAELKAAEEARQRAEAERLAAEETARRELEERLATSGGLRLPARPFITEVSAEWTNRAHAALRVSHTTTLATTREGVDLRRHDFAKVVPPTEWLNDEIINGSLNWLDHAINSAAGIKDVRRVTRKCLSMSSFFFKRLQEQGVSGTQRTLRRCGVEKNNMLDVDTILLPICEHSHWTLLVIRPSKRTVAHMDSMNPRGTRSYIDKALEWIKDFLGDLFVENEWNVIRHDSPRQTNGYDCGIHTITNGICLALGLSPVDCYTSVDMPQQRIRIACMLLNGGFKDDFDLRVF